MKVTIKAAIISVFFFGATPLMAESNHQSDSLLGLTTTLDKSSPNPVAPIVTVGSRLVDSALSNDWSTGLSARVGFGSNANSNAYLLGLQQTVRYHRPIFDTGFAFYSDFGLGVHMLHQVVNKSTPEAVNAAEYLWNGALDGVVNVGAKKQFDSLTLGVELDFAQRLYGTTAWRNFDGQKLSDTSAPSQLGGVFVNASYALK